MIRIGLVDLDTSHPHAFTRILKTIPGVEVNALWDGHDVWPDEYAHSFAREHGIPIVCDRLEEMPDHVDAAMVLGANWDAHLEKALVFMRAGRPVLIDKPVVGSVRACDQLLDLQAKFGTLVFGGSSLRFAKEVTTLREAIGARGNLLSVVAAGPGDFFGYGIHTTEMLQGFTGSGIRSVKPIADGGHPVLGLTLNEGLPAILYLQMDSGEWSLCAFTDKGLRTATVGTEGLYEPFLRNFVALLKGGHAEYSLEGPVEAVRIHIAAKISLAGGKEVLLQGLPGDAGFSGRAYVEEYAATQRQRTTSAARL